MPINQDDRRAVKFTDIAGELNPLRYRRYKFDFPFGIFDADINLCRGGMFFDVAQAS